MSRVSPNSNQPSPRPATKPASNSPQPVSARNAPRPQRPIPAKKSSNQEAAEEFDEPQTNWFQDFLNDSPSWLTSLIVHMAVLLLLAFWMLPKPDLLNFGTELVAVPDQKEEIEELPEVEIQQLELDQMDIDTPDAFELQPETDVIEDEPMISPADDLTAAQTAVALDPLGENFAPKSELTNKIGSFTGNGLSGRGHAARSALVRKGGGNGASEAAVAMALEWLAKHQLKDGGWCFDHTQAPDCNGQCANPGRDFHDARNGATGMALLPFLGAGYTHKEGKYAGTVTGGLYYLQGAMEKGPNGGALMDGGHAGMYSHGLATIALTEAYGMTLDRQLAGPAQLAVNWIVHAQDPVGGGWRYQPQTPGDTSVVGWQIMALKSAHMAYLQVPPGTIKNAIRFLDSVSLESGTYYGYTSPGKGQATTAIGILCRLYTGWKPDDDAPQRAAEAIANWGPSKNNMYYNYYAMQFMFQQTGGKGDVWKKWNTELRDYLINTQAQNGHQKGSWHFTNNHGTKAGRLYNTAMATMILEVYYRHMPIYREQATKDDFPL